MPEIAHKMPGGLGAPEAKLGGRGRGRDEEPYTAHRPFRVGPKALHPHLGGFCKDRITR